MARSLCRTVSSVLVILLAGCQTTNSPVQNLDNEQLYKTSLADAAIVEGWEITSQLNPVSIDNEKLTWKRVNGRDYVLAVTWAGNDVSWAKNKPETGFMNTGKYDNWITLVPDVKEFCSDMREADLQIKLEQGLGLPPEGKKANFIEYWVQPKDIFRPCPDPEIHDTTCQINTSSSTRQSHIDWLDKQKIEGKGYPWTKLGYTYNWSSFGPNKIGLSEYVISKNSDVIVNSTYSTKEYCR